MKNYDATIEFWNNIFKDSKPSSSIKSGQMHEDLERACDWLCENPAAILDYGCGNGSLLLRCIARNEHSTGYGIDIAQKAIDLACETARLNGLEHRAKLICGGVELLADIQDHSFDAAILSNIIDNVLPKDTATILADTHRILKPGGKLLLKLNPYITCEQIKEYGLTHLGEGLYLEKDGIYLRNLTSAQWEALLSELFIIHEYKEIYYKEHDQTNRMVLLVNK